MRNAQGFLRYNPNVIEVTDVAENSGEHVAMKTILLPFFDDQGRNIYACTKCFKKFGPSNVNQFGSDNKIRPGYIGENYGVGYVEK